MMTQQDRDLLALRLKLSSKITKYAFLSTGSPADKERILPSAKQLAALDVEIYATEGTSAHLEYNGVPNIRVHRISEGGEPNVRPLLEAGRFDLVVNVLTGDHDHDEHSDARIIRALAIEHGVPIITDTEVAVATINRMARDIRAERRRKSGIVDMREYFHSLVHARGGYVANHYHWDKSNTMKPEYLALGQEDMEQKWVINNRIKEGYTFEDLVSRMSHCADMCIGYGITHASTMVDADSTVKTLCMDAALQVKRRYAGRLVVEIGTQPLKGVVDPTERYWFERCNESSDFVGGLPSRDRPLLEKHLDIGMSIAKSKGSDCWYHAHVCQQNNPEENETELLALKTIEHGMQGRVAAVHAISLACKPDHERKRVIALLKDAGVTVIVCPSAALGMKQLDRQARLHNSIAPVVELVEAGVNVCLGVDNVQDLYEPFVESDPWVETRMLMEACRWYDAEAIADLVCNKSLFKNTEIRQVMAAQ